MTKLSDYVEFQNGYAFKSSEYASSGHYLIRIKNVQQGFIEISDKCYVGISKSSDLNKFELKKGDIVISLTGNVGRIARIKSEHLPAALNQRVAKVATKNEKILNSEYLYYLLRTPKFFEFAINSGKGAAQQNISTSDMSNFSVNIPTLQNQLKIVEKLDKAFAEIDSLEKGIEQIQINIEKIDSTLLLNLWDKYRKDLTLKKLSDVADYENGKAHENLIDENGDFKLVNSKFISTGGLKFKRTSIALSPLSKGEIAMVLSDVPNGKALAKCFLVDKNDAYSLNQRICKISSRALIPEYLFINLNRNPYLLGFNNGENQTNLRLKDVLNTPLYFTDILTQELIVKEYKEQFTYINIYKANLGKKLNLLRNLKQSFLGNEFSASGLAA